jgi:hypothetical protein
LISKFIRISLADVEIPYIALLSRYEFYKEKSYNWLDIFYVKLIFAREQFFYNLFDIAYAITLCWSWEHDWVSSSKRTIWGSLILLRIEMFVGA